jgi:Helix-turn-helix domain
MADRFTSDQFNWLRQVAFDSDLSPVTSRVAIALTKYFSRKRDGWSWMSQDTISSDLGVSVRTVGNAISALVRQGHLLAKRRGMKETNLYHLALKSADHDRKEPADYDRVTGKNVPSDRQIRVKVTGKNLPTNPLKEPLEQPTEEIDSPQLDLDDDGRRGSDPPSQSENNTDAAFEAFWQAYPKKVDKAKARVAYRRVIRGKQATAEGLLHGAINYAAERRGQDPRFTKYPASWLSAESWNNEMASAGANYATVRSGQPDHAAVAEQLARQHMAKSGGGYVVQ